ncbi:MAG: SRPBCC family protein [Planctomycetes bacterium]|nr:SRPBCC family protein [Planctomycetota bacterium]
MSTPRLVFRALVFALAGMVVVFVAVGYLLAGEWHVESQREIGAPPARIAALVGDLSSWATWAAMEPNLGPPTTRSVLGAAGTEGHALRWSGPRGTATLTLRQVAADGIVYDFVGEGPERAPMQWRANGRITWTASAGGTAVRWYDEGHWDSLPGRWIGWFGAMQERARQIQTTSLAGLAEAVEANPAGQGSR